MKASWHLQRLLVVVLLVARVTCKNLPGDRSDRLLQEDSPPLVGIGFTSTLLTSWTSYGDIEQKITETLEHDHQVTVVSVQLSALLCSSLPEAQDAPMLAFEIGPDEVITASQVSYQRFDGDSFEDGEARMTWKGKVVDPPQADDEAEPRGVSMTWTDDCDPDMFMLKVTTVYKDGSTSVMRTVPCEAGSATDICVVHLSLHFDEEDYQTEHGSSETTNTTGSSSRHLRAYNRLHSGGRALDTLFGQEVSIDVAVFYSDAALTSLGVTETQMQSEITTAFPDLDRTVQNSDIDLHFHLVHLGKIPYEETFATASSTSLDAFEASWAVTVLREIFQADLLLLVTDLDNSCGRGNVYNGRDTGAYSVMDVNCLDDFSHVHEIGHNLGCHHNRENTLYDTDYSHGMRYCNDSSPYRTVMSYRCVGTSAPRVDYFSNPDVNYWFKPTGTATENNAQTIRDHMATVSNFRGSSADERTSSFVTSASDETPLPYVSLGCYQDSETNRVLSGEHVKGITQMTTELCAEMCIGSAYFGTGSGNACYCGLATGEEFRDLVTATCDMDCAGDANQACGGLYAISLYRYGTNDITPVSATNLGCYADDIDDRIMERSPGDTTLMNNHACEELCSGHAFFGTQFGRECWCGDESTDYERHGMSDDCTYGCAGNPADICGGSYAMTVYKY